MRLDRCGANNGLRINRRVGVGGECNQLTDLQNFLIELLFELWTDFGIFFVFAYLNQFLLTRAIVWDQPLGVSFYG